MKNCTIIFVFFLFFSLSIFAQVSDKPIKGSNSSSEVIENNNSTYDWEIVTSPVTTALSAVCIVNRTNCWIAGDGGVVLKSNNGGTTWTKCTNVTGNVDLYCISAYDENKVIVGDGSGNIFRTTDGGTTWANVSTNAGSFMDVVDYVNADLAYAIGDPTGSVWRLLKSTDGGATWNLATSLAAASGEAGWNCSYERIGLNVWFGTNKTKIYKSSTGLEGPWTSGATGSYVNSYGIAFSDEMNGIATVNDATNGKIMKTTDGGVSWVLTTYPVTGLSNLPDFVHGTPYVWVGTFSSGIRHSSDYGSTWVTDNLPTTVTGINAIKVNPDVNSGIACGAAGLILKSTIPDVIPVELTSFTAFANGGSVNLNWQTATETNNNGFEIQRKLNESDPDWTIVGFKPGAGTTTNITSYSFTDNLICSYSNNLFYRLKQIDFDGSINYSKTIEVENILPTKISLDQNFPNPFNPSTKISFMLPSNSNVLLELYNINGEKVATLINGIKNSGYHVYELDIKNLVNNSLSSGMYIYKLTALDLTSKNVVSLAKKMILLK